MPIKAAKLTPEAMSEAISLVAVHGTEPEEVARAFAVRTATLKAWVKAAIDSLPRDDAGKTVLDNLADLKRERYRLEAERAALLAENAALLAEIRAVQADALHLARKAER